jgi:uncharacterized membrane protein YgcG
MEKCYRSIPQVLTLDWECTGNLITMHWDAPTNKFIEFEGRKHRQFNSMYVTTLKVAKDHHTLTLGPKCMCIANVGHVGSSKSRSGGGGGSSGGGGGSG